MISGEQGRGGPRSERFRKEVDAKTRRKIKARRRKSDSIWYGLGMFGTIGWSVAIPTVIGVALGIWIDTRWPGRVSWTITLLFVGVVLGCVNAWYWVKRERESIESERRHPDV
jgi:ATP synthase protein I